MGACDKNYTQVEKEALSLVFGVKRFHQFLDGRKFTLVTNHKPLQAILGLKSAVPTLAAARMQRWAPVLSTYDYDLVYHRSEEHSNADPLSRLPYQDSSIAMEGKVYTLGAVREDFPIMAMDIAQATLKDPLLCKVHQYTMNGWPETCDDMELKPFHNRRYELSCEQGCVLWGIRVVVPALLRRRLLNELH